MLMIAIALCVGFIAQGTAVVPATGGRYFVVNHGRMKEVSSGLWWLARMSFPLLWPGVGVFVVFAALGCVLVLRGRPYISKSVWCRINTVAYAMIMIVIATTIIITIWRMCSMLLVRLNIGP
jgi:hypothetical protein